MVCVSIKRKTRFCIKSWFSCGNCVLKLSAHTNKVNKVNKKNNSGKKIIKSVEKGYNMFSYVKKFNFSKKETNL